MFSKKFNSWTQFSLRTENQSIDEPCLSLLILSKCLYYLIFLALLHPAAKQMKTLRGLANKKY